MNQQAYKKSFVIGVVAIGVIAGVAVGFFPAHRTMGDSGTDLGMLTEQEGEIGEIESWPWRQMGMT